MCCILLVAPLATAHKPSDSYLTLQVGEREIQGQWDIALRDLDHAIGLDDDQDGAITWGEGRAHHAEVAAYTLARLELSVAGAVCPTRVLEHLVDDHSDGAYAVLRFAAACSAAADPLRVGYRLFFDVDPQHRGLLRLEQSGQTRTAIFSNAAAQQTFELAEASALRQFFDYTAHGVWHIWVGFDHLLFLLSLLVPAVLVRVDRRWTGAEKFSDSFGDVVKVVTAFTLAHSITLSLAALNNLIVIAGSSRWLFAFAFGLIHGFGFASVLADLGLPHAALLLALVAFNVGVELGQLAVVAVFLPLAWLLRRQWIYRQGVLAGGSLLVIALASVWLVERAFDLRVLM